MNIDKMSHSPSSKKIVRFSTVMDWWLAAAIILSITILISSLVVIGMGDSVLAKIIAFFVVVFTSVSIVDKTFFTSYVLAPEKLIVQSQLRRAEFPYRTMTKIRPGSFFSLLTRPNHKRFAISSNCLIIEMNKTVPHWKSISVSPYKRDEFLKELLHHIDAERSRRVSSSKA